MPKTILIAEDNDSNYLLLSKLINKSYNIIRAKNGLEAVELFPEIKPDLILMDIKMPVMNGLEATAKIRESDTQIPIIAITANAFEEDKQNALKVGCTRFLTKPINIKLLNSTLIEFLDN